jgi:hypothetical protein
MLARMPETVVGPTFDTNSSSDIRLLLWLAWHGHSPNLLIRCPRPDFDAVGQHVLRLCAGPIRVCSLPGPLLLPERDEGTLLLNDVAALRCDQQIILNDWISAGSGRVRIVSVTSAPLAPLVENGTLFEELFYRLNVVQLDFTRHAA